MKQDDHDTEKLHLESLQLRNQQFYLGTLALAGSGLTALIAPAASALTEGEIPQIALVGAAICWLVLLTLLYQWSLGLRRVISIISRYLEERGMSRWEPDFRELYESRGDLFPSQSRFVSLAFSIYGALAVGSSILAAVSSPEKIILTELGYYILGACLTIYLVVVWVGHLRRASKDDEIVEAWKLHLSQKRSEQGGADQPATAPESESEGRSQ